MSRKSTTRKLLISALVLCIVAWAEAGLAMVQPEPVMQCSMSAHEMQAPAGNHPQCCSTSDAPERPLAFEVSSVKSKAPTLEVVAALAAASAAPAAPSFRVRRSVDVTRYVKPVLELKTDLRI